MKKKLIIITGITSKITINTFLNINLNYQEYKYILCSREKVINNEIILFLNKINIDNKNIDNQLIDFSYKKNINNLINIIYKKYKNYKIHYFILSHAIGELNKHINYQNIININFNSYVLLLNKLHNKLTYESKILIYGSQTIHRFFIKNYEIFKIFHNHTYLNENKIYGLTKILLDIYFYIYMNNYNLNIYIICPGYNNTKMTEHHNKLNNIIKSDPINSGYLISKLLNNNYKSDLYSLIFNNIYNRRYNLFLFSRYEMNLFYNIVNYKLFKKKFYYKFNYKFDNSSIINITSNILVLETINNNN